MTSARSSLLLRVAAWLLLGLLSSAGPAASLDPDSADFYHMARHFMTSNEEKIFRNLAGTEYRREFIRAFWEIRDLDPNTEENEFRNEVEARFEFINKYFREGNRPGWDTARGMVYLVLGPPNMLNVMSQPPSSGDQDDLMVWDYRELGFRVVFVDRQGFGVYELDMVNT